MGISFHERMSGEVVDPAGASHHVELHLRGATRRIRGLVFDGRARLTGAVTAPPWAAAAPLTGTLDVSPIRGRCIVYDLRFVGTDGAGYRIVGRKDLDPLRLAASMSSLATVIERDGLPIGQGELRFDWNDVLAFARSFVHDTGLAGADPLGRNQAGHPPGELLGPMERELLEALAEAVITPGEYVPAVDAKTHALTLAVLPHLPPHVLPLYAAGLRALDAAARLRTGKRFAALPPERRRDVIDHVSRGAGHGLVLALGMPIKTAHFSRREYLDRVGLPTYENPISEPEPRWLANVLVPETMEPLTELDCDVVIIGTGAGGGAAAATLAEAGLAVVMVEEGRYQRRSAFAGGPEERLLRFWRDGGMNLTVGNLPVMVPLGRMVGGSTAINSGTCFRTPDEVLAEWRMEGLPSDFAPEPFAGWLDRAESELGVAEGDRRWLGDIAHCIARGAEAMRPQYPDLRHGALRRNAPGCDGQGLCVVGCPTDAKRSSNVSWVPRALRAGATLCTGLAVTNLLMSGQRCHGLEATGHETSGAPRRLVVRARAVVVACGTLHTPVLLQRAGVRLPALGRNLSIHPALGVYARFDESLGEPWRAIPQSYFVEGLVDPRVRFEGFYAPPQLSAPSLPFDGPELTRWLDAWPHVGQFGFMVRDRGVGRVLPGPGGRPLAHYPITDDVLALFRRGSAALAELMLRGGACEVATGIEGIGTVTTVEQARAIAHTPRKARHFRAMGFHPLGTCRVGVDPATAVCDPTHRVFGTQNVYVMDGASVPSSLGVNPQVTIMAMALRAADLLAASLSDTDSRPTVSAPPPASRRRRPAPAPEAAAHRR